MRKRFYLFSLLISLPFAACNDEKEIKTDQNPQSTASLRPQPTQEYRFDFKNTEGKVSNLIIRNNIHYFVDIKKPIVLVNFFSTWCPPCRGLMPHLNNLQKKYHEDFSVLGLLLHDTIDHSSLQTSITSNKIKYFISSDLTTNQKFANQLSPRLKLPKNFDLPLMIIFVEGKYYTHYEGVLPEEMIASDIKQALNKIKGS